MPPAKKQKAVADANGEQPTYQPKNILITGGAGFIASHVVIQIVQKFPQYKVVCLDKLDYCSSLANLNEIKDAPNFKFVKGNILSSDLVKYVLETEEIDTIIHAAAQTHVDNSFGNSFTFTENNVMGTHVLAETAKICGIKRFIHVSTDEVYGSSYDEVRGGERARPLSATRAQAARSQAARVHAPPVPPVRPSFSLPIAQPLRALGDLFSGEEALQERAPVLGGLELCRCDH